MPADTQTTRDGRVVYVGDLVVDKYGNVSEIYGFNVRDSGVCCRTNDGETLIGDLYSSEVARLQHMKDAKQRTIAVLRKEIRDLNKRIKNEITSRH